MLKAKSNYEKEDIIMEIRGGVINKNKFVSLFK